MPRLMVLKTNDSRLKIMHKINDVNSSHSLGSVLKLDVVRGEGDWRLPSGRMERNDKCVGYQFAPAVKPPSQLLCGNL